jgi:hypothetical protein
MRRYDTRIVPYRSVLRLREKRGGRVEEEKKKRTLENTL